LVQLCLTCGVQAETIEALVEHGILEPSGRRGIHWSFRAANIRRTRTAVRLQRDLDVNLPGAALALELLERINELEARLRAVGGRSVTN
ncbi:MAG: chaperone modulator CbpM, partial [Steroidobacteraceae bacterium]|nr:chaperone modulator CbpM [Steroidobacteraceae bacterium]